MKYKVLGLILVFIFGLANLAGADQLSQARSLFYQGNNYYGDGDFAQAVANYEGALTLGFSSGPLYYNLGNAYFKQGSLGKAILNYLRAKRLMPRDADLNSNLEYAQSQIDGGVIKPGGNWLWRLFFRLVTAFSLDELYLFSAGVYVILALFLIVLILSKTANKPLTYLVYALTVILIISAGLSAAQFRQTVSLRQAVVTAGQLYSKFEPFTDATTYFSLSEGETVFVLDSKDEWAKVRRLDGRLGWVKQSEIELL
ncbi:tetratricopeptide repeat protein [Candidatus Omnitrophota bacterium]